MPALGFQKQFAPKVESGEKCRTIRSLRADGRPPCAVGKELKLYTGMRTPQCRLLRTVMVTRLSLIELQWDRAYISSEPVDDLDRLAVMDGFKDYPEMRDWFQKTHGLPFTGWLIEWGQQ